MFILLGEILDLLLADRPKAASAQVVQGMKAVQGYVVSGGDWAKAWPHTFLPDPVTGKRHGAKEEELEAVLSMLKTQRDIEKSIRTVADEVSAEEEGGRRK